MKKSQLIRAWRDEEYRQTLSDEELAALPDHPAGQLDADDGILGSVSAGCCPPDTIPTLCNSICFCVTTPEFSCTGGSPGFC